MQRTIKEELVTPITSSSEVCVVGGGVAGIAAAMSDCFASLDVRELQKRLKARSVRLK